MKQSLHVIYYILSTSLYLKREDLKVKEIEEFEEKERGERIWEGCTTTRIKDNLPNTQFCSVWYYRKDLKEKEKKREGDV